MSEYDNTNRGAIWKNEDKTTENHPDFKGSINVNGIDYWVSAWKRKEGGNPNAPALSFTVQAKEQKPENNGGGGNDFEDDDIPFS